MTSGDDFVGIIPVVMMPAVLISFRGPHLLRNCLPIECQGIARYHLDSIVCWGIAHDIATHVDRGEIFNRGIVVASLSGRAIVCWDTNALEVALVHTIQVHTLLVLIKTGRHYAWKEILTQMNVCAAAWLESSERRSAEVRAILTIVRRDEMAREGRSAQEMDKECTSEDYISIT